MNKDNSKLLEIIGTVIYVFFGVLITNFFAGDRLNLFPDNKTPSVKESSDPIDIEKTPYRNRLNTDIGIMTENRTWDEVQQQLKMNNACAWGRPECPY